MSKSEDATSVHYTKIQIDDVIYHPHTKQWPTVTGIDTHQATAVESKGERDQTAAIYETSRTFHFDKGLDVESWEYKPDGMVPRRGK